MRVFRATNKLVVRMLKDKLLDEVLDYESKESYMAHLEAMLLEQPDNICIIVGVAGDLIVSYAIAFRHESYNHVYLDSCWTDPQYHKISKHVLNHLKLWASSQGLTEIRAETKRKETRALERYGFKEFSRIISLRF